METRERTEGEVSSIFTQARIAIWVNSYIPLSLLCWHVPISPCFCLSPAPVNHNGPWKNTLYICRSGLIVSLQCPDVGFDTQKAGEGELLNAGLSDGRHCHSLVSSRSSTTDNCYSPVRRAGYPVSAKIPTTLLRYRYSSIAVKSLQILGSAVLL